MHTWKLAQGVDGETSRSRHNASFQSGGDEHHEFFITRIIIATIFKNLIAHVPHKSPLQPDSCDSMWQVWWHENLSLHFPVFTEHHCCSTSCPKLRMILWIKNIFSINFNKLAVNFCCGNIFLFKIAHHGMYLIWGPPVKGSGHL